MIERQEIDAFFLFVCCSKKRGEEMLKQFVCCCCVAVKNLNLCRVVVAVVTCLHTVDDLG